MRRRDRPARMRDWVGGGGDGLTPLVVAVVAAARPRGRLEDIAGLVEVDPASTRRRRESRRCAMAWLLRRNQCLVSLTGDMVPVGLPLPIVAWEVGYNLGGPLLGDLREQAPEELLIAQGLLVVLQVGDGQVVGPSVNLVGLNSFNLSSRLIRCRRWAIGYGICDFTVDGTCCVSAGKAASPAMAQLALVRFWLATLTAHLTVTWLLGLADPLAWLLNRLPTILLMMSLTGILTRLPTRFLRRHLMSPMGCRKIYLMSLLQRPLAGVLVRPLIEIIGLLLLVSGGLSFVVSMPVALMVME